MLKIRYLVITCVLFFLHLTAGYLNAQTADTTIIQIEELTGNELELSKDINSIEVISASRTSKKISDLPVTIYVITREEIQENGYVTLVDVLKTLPGIKVSQPGSGEFGEMFQMRGMLGNEYAKILINNIPVRPSVVSGMPIEAQLPIRQAERIEVIYGPASALYGADATVGVINIITKEANNGIFSTADISLGSDMYGYVNFQAGGKAGRNKNILKYSFYGSRSNVDNLDIFQDTALYHPYAYLEQMGMVFDLGGTQVKPTALTSELAEQYGITDFLPSQPHYEGTIEMPEISNIPTESQLIGVELSFRGFNLGFRNMRRTTHSSIGRTPFFYKYNNPRNFISDQINQFILGYNKQFKRFYNTTNFQVESYNYDPYSSFGVTFTPLKTPATYYQYNQSGDILLEELLNFKIKKVEVTAGFNFQFSGNLPHTNYSAKPFDVTRVNYSTVSIASTDSVEAFGLNPFVFATTASFVQAYYSIGPINFVAGIRSDYNGLYFERSFNPRAALLYKITKTISLRGSVGKAYKAPTGNQMYESLAFENTTEGGIHYAIVPNADLKPESFLAYELGFRASLLNSSLFIDISAYKNDFYDIITAAVLDPEQEGFYLANNYEGEPLARTSRNSNAESVLQGVDFSSELRNILNDRLRLGFSASYAYGSEILDDGVTIDYFRGMPKYILKGMVHVKPTRNTYLTVRSITSDGWYRLYAEPTASPEDAYVNGYNVFDVIAGFRFHKNLNIWLKIKNFTNQNYGGIDGTGFDVDLRYNPQLARTVSFGMTFNLN